MVPTYTAAERRALAEAVSRGERPLCPACGAAVARHEVAARGQLPYVRRRVLLICPSCRRRVVVESRRRF